MQKVEFIDNPQELGSIDKSGMLECVLAMPAHLQKAKAVFSSLKPPKIKKINNLVIAGMGGSAIAGDVIADLLSEKLPFPLIVSRNYKIPAFIGKETLFLAISYSGETEETLAALKEAETRGASSICFTSGGKLQEIAAAKKYPSYKLPAGFQPRAAFPYILTAVLKCLEGFGLIQNLAEEIDEAVWVLEKTRQEIGIARPLRTNSAKRLAQKLVGRIPLIFAVTGSSAAAGLRLKCQFNENSKSCAVLYVLPEMNHNEIVNLFELKNGCHNFSALFLRDEKDTERIKKRIEITKSLLSRQLGGYTEIFSQGESKLARILSLIYYGDLLSVYIPLLRKADPTPVEAISRLKKELKR
ncbi:MAG: bifunctional phosphoglucose/phosphomannose isomerase [Candidatus Margulisbacteria bacterium]|nr:bifunctional phosphoglucose/phosphomannose isomerase [Candidatus Margulisiibacteriota bacterium]